jgi:hypothetical protein
VTRATAKGEVSHLAKLADFTRNYAAVGAEATAGGGAATTQGASLRLGAEGIRLTLAK